MHVSCSLLSRLSIEILSLCCMYIRPVESFRKFNAYIVIIVLYIANYV